MLALSAGPVGGIPHSLSFTPQGLAECYRSSFVTLRMTSVKHFRALLHLAQSFGGGHFRVWVSLATSPLAGMHRSSWGLFQPLFLLPPLCVKGSEWESLDTEI